MANKDQTLAEAVAEVHEAWAGMIREVNKILEPPIEKIVKILNGSGKEGTK